MSVDEDLMCSFRILKPADKSKLLVATQAEGDAKQSAAGRGSGGPSPPRRSKQ